MLRFTILFFCFLSFGISAQNRQSNLLIENDSIIVEFSPTIGKVYYHKMEAKETVFSLAQTFDQHLRDLEVANPGIDLNKLALDQEISIPFLSTSLAKHPNELEPGIRYKPVFYKVIAKDNFFRIARIYFNQSIENLLDINQIESFNLNVGQLLKVGWIAMDKPQNLTPTVVQENKQLITQQPKISTENSSAAAQKKEPIIVQTKPAGSVVEDENMLSKLKKTFGIKSKKKDIKEVVILSEQLEENPEFQEPQERKIILAEIEANKTKPGSNSTKVPLSSVDITKQVVKQDAPLSNEIEIVKKPEIVFKSEKGIAIWNQSSTDSKNLFALHSTAKVGTYIEITNPMMNKTVQAKVIGNIPPRTYTDDVSLVISPRVAKSLGVVDRRFLVKIKYQE